MRLIFMSNHRSRPYWTRLLLQYIHLNFQGFYFKALCFYQEQIQLEKNLGERFLLLVEPFDLCVFLWVTA